MKGYWRDIRVGVANWAVRLILRITGTAIMYEGIILNEEDVLMVPPEALE